MSQSGRSRVKVDGHSDESKCRSGRSESVKVDSLRVSKWTVRKYQSGQSESVKVDGLKVSKWTVQKYQSGRSNTLTLNELIPSAP